MASITPTDILTKPLFNWSDVADLRQPAVKAEKDKKQAILQNEYCDSLFENILQNMASPDVVKAHLLEKPTVPVLIWTANEVFFEPHSSIPRRDCRSELFAQTGITVEEYVISNGLHEIVESSIPYHESQSMYAVLKYTDILHLLAARWDSSIAPHFTCERYTSPCGESNTYWRPQEHVIWLRFWPDGVPARHAESQKAALDGYEDRYRKRHPRIIHNPEDE
jgi:hypothetical protein